ncbi:PepSY domain-containing protein [Salimicrobium halophilum]|uniref:Uncharacterized membrane protein YkoI n=1 Tax=Salimicrobium halophilum TaxID=86666 RepID=A0A1G8S6D6_9BACI|nr:PepSY domain-containing protein [Salimicrobium halophilum]SDJ24743.1 Uncharacterized membrane protein YkoI [Salimicrobium halophilum]
MSRKIIGVMLVLLVFGVISWFVMGAWQEEALDSEEARDLVTSHYQGSILEWKEDEERFIATVERDTGVYAITIDRESATVEDVRRLEENAIEKESEAPSETEEEPLRLLTEEEAGINAQEEVAGTIDDIDYEQEGDIPYYLVEIERSDEREATVQIHAINGEVMSITWDD